MLVSKSRSSSGLHLGQAWPGNGVIKTREAKTEDLSTLMFGYGYDCFLDFSCIALVWVIVKYHSVDGIEDWAIALLNVRLMTTTSQSNELLPYETCPHCLILDCQTGRCLALFEECLLRISTLKLKICIEVCKRELRALFDTRCNSRAINLPALPSLASFFRDQGPGIKVPLCHQGIQNNLFLELSDHFHI